MRRLYTVDIEERPTRWSETQRVRGGGSGTLDRLIVFVGLLFFCAALVTGVVGSVVYVVKTGANANIRATQCKVIASSLIPQTCAYRDCTSLVDPNSGQCQQKPQACFGLQWSVQFRQVDSEGEYMPGDLTGSVYDAWINESTVRDQDMGHKLLDKYQINKSYTCSYLASDPNFVKWGYDDPEPWLIMMIVSWSIVGLFLCALGFSWFFAKDE